MGENIAIENEGEVCTLTADQLFKQSFNRFDDNLVENILSYLTFSKKSEFESVSKQFRRSVYNQQTELQLNRWEDEGNDSFNSILEPIEVIDFNSATAVANGLKQINKIWLKSLLKKCKSIERVVLDCYLDLEDLDIICRNCPKLKSIQFDTSGLCADDLAHFGNRYGEIFEKVEFCYLFVAPKYWNNFLIHCKNLRELFSQNFYKLFLEDKDYLPKLEVINDYQILFDHGEDEENGDKTFERFCDKFSQTLTKFTFSVNGDMKTKEIDTIFNSLCKLNKLKTLEFYCYSINENEHGIDKYISQLSQSVPELKKLRMSLYSTNSLKVNQFFNSFHGFNNLVDLDVFIYGYNENTVFEGSVECLKSSKNLKSLIITIETIGEEFFHEIDKHLPNLLKLVITTESDITDKTIFQLSHLKKLKDFNLNRFQKSSKLITDDSICSVINGCPALEEFVFGSRINITDKTIEALIDCANNYPKRRIHFESGSPGEGEEDLIPAINMLSFVDKIPENLTIHYIDLNNEE